MIFYGPKRKEKDMYHSILLPQKKKKKIDANLLINLQKIYEHVSQLNMTNLFID